jgi:hypothetical protein
MLDTANPTIHRRVNDGHGFKARAVGFDARGYALAGVRALDGDDAMDAPRSDRRLPRLFPSSSKKCRSVYGGFGAAAVNTANDSPLCGTCTVFSLACLRDEAGSMAVPQPANKPELAPAFVFGPALDNAIDDNASGDAIFGYAGDDSSTPCRR